MIFGKSAETWQAIKCFKQLSADKRRIVFYSESKAYWPHLGPLVQVLAQELNQQVCYLTSDTNDPGLHQEHPNILPFYIGDGTARTVLFKELQADILVMTMPDLNTMQIHRSVHPVHYVYVFHSIVSTHMIYRKAAFDHFDTILCVGPHHREEIRENEKIYGLPPKNLVDHGYGRLDAMILEPTMGKKVSNGPKRILIAPSWGPQGLLETVGDTLVEVLLDAGYHVTVRPHPQTRRLTPKSLDSLLARFEGNLRFQYEENVASQESLLQSDLMISDWSGAALEYAFARLRPVLFIDVPRKVNNSEYEKISTPPLEVFIREEIGTVLSTEDLSKAPEMIESLLSNMEDYTEKARQLRERWVFNLGSSATVGAKAILALLGTSPTSPVRAQFQDWGSCHSPFSLLEMAAAEARKTFANPPETHSTEHFLLKLCDGTLDLHHPDVRQTLVILCRKVDIAKKLYAGYDTTWKKKLNEIPLPSSWYPVLTAALLCQAKQEQEAQQRGMALKFANAALNTVQLYETTVAPKDLRRKLWSLALTVLDEVLAG